MADDEWACSFWAFSQWACNRPKRHVVLPPGAVSTNMAATEAADLSKLKAASEED